MDINEFSKGLNDPKLKEAVNRLGNTQEGKNLLNKITPAERENLINQLGKLSSNSISKELLLQQLNNPDILKQLNSFINGKR